MVDSELLQRRLERLDEYLIILQRLSQYTYGEFIADPERYGSAERFLELSIQLIDDMGNHVVAAERLGRVEAAADIPRLLHDHGIVDDALADCPAAMIGFRNVLAHEYMEIDRRQVYENLTQRLDDFGQFRRVFGRML